MTDPEALRENFEEVQSTPEAVLYSAPTEAAPEDMEHELAIPSDVDPEALKFILDKADTLSGKFIERGDMGQDDCATELAIVGIGRLSEYDPEKGSIAAFVGKRMDGAFLDILRNNYIKDGQPRSAYNKLKKLKEGTPEYKDMTHDLVGKGVNIHPIVSLDQPLYDSAEVTTRLDKIASSRKEIDPETADSKELQELIYDCKDLSKREQDIALKYLVGGMNLREIGDDYGVTESRISQLWGKTLEKIKVHLAVSGSIQTSPQEKVYNWMGSLKDHELLHDTDIRFAQNQLSNLFIHYDTTEEGTETIFTLTIKNYDEGKTSLLKAHGLLDQFSDVSIYELEGKHAIRLVLPEKLTEPVDLQTVASIDHMLNFHSIRQNKKPTHGEPLDRYHKPTSQWLADNLSPKTFGVISSLASSNQRIAKNMTISESTVRTHIHNASNATGLTSDQLCLVMYEVGLLDFDKEIDAAIAQSEFTELSPLHEKCLQLTADGLTYEEVASKTPVTTNAVRAQLHEVYGKLLKGEPADSRAACLVAYANGKIEMPQKVVQFMKSALNDVARDSLAELVKD